MRLIILRSDDLCMFHEDIDANAYEYYCRHKDAFRRMYDVQGKDFWLRFMLSFRSSQNQEIIQLFQGKIKHLMDYIDFFFINVHEEFIDGPFSKAKQFFEDIVTVVQDQGYVSILQLGSLAKNPFHRKETKDIYKRFFGNPARRSSYTKVFILLPLYRRFAGSLCVCLRRWLEAPEMKDANDLSYWVPSATPSLDSFSTNDQNKFSETEKIPEKNKEGDVEMQKLVGVSGCGSFSQIPEFAQFFMNYFDTYNSPESSSNEGEEESYHFVFKATKKVKLQKLPSDRNKEVNKKTSEVGMKPKKKSKVKQETQKTKECEATTMVDDPVNGEARKSKTEDIRKISLTLKECKVEDECENKKKLELGGINYDKKEVRKESKFKVSESRLEKGKGEEKTECRASDLENKSGAKSNKDENDSEVKEEQKDGCEKLEKKTKVKTKVQKDSESKSETENRKKLKSNKKSSSQTLKDTTGVKECETKKNLNKLELGEGNEEKECSRMGGGKIIRTCVNCGMSEPAPKVFKKCKRCKDEGIDDPAYYCGRDCQVLDWNARHRREHEKLVS